MNKNLVIFIIAYFLLFKYNVFYFIIFYILKINFILFPLNFRVKDFINFSYRIKNFFLYLLKLAILFHTGPFI